MDEVGYGVGLPTQGFQVVGVNPGHALPLLRPLSRENLPLLGRAKQQEEVTCRTGEVLGHVACRRRRKKALPLQCLYIKAGNRKVSY